MEHKRDANAAGVAWPKSSKTKDLTVYGGEFSPSSGVTSHLGFDPHETDPP